MFFRYYTQLMRWCAEGKKKAKHRDKAGDRRKRTPRTARGVVLSAVGKPRPDNRVNVVLTTVSARCTSLAIPALHHDVFIASGVATITLLPIGLVRS
jgi:hypothetical protein